LSAERLTRAEIAAAAAFVGQVIFKPWSEHGEGPDSYSCWGLAKAAQHALAGLTLPMVETDPHDVAAVVRAIENSPLRAEWQDVARPRHLDLVRMSHSRRAHHIGTYLGIDGGGILHAAQQFDAKGNPAPRKPGVAFTPMHVLPLEGWARFVPMRHLSRMAAS
jgi:hypothetical protein